MILLMLLYIRSDSELSDLGELSSDDEIETWSPPDDNSQSNEQSDCDDVIEESASSDEEPLASITKKKGDPKTYKFNRRQAFIPYSNLEFIDAALEPEPKEDTPYTYFKYFVTDEMLNYLGEESNIYTHQKSGFTPEASPGEIEIFLGLYFYMGLVRMPAVGCLGESYTRYRPIVDIMSRNRFQTIASHLHIVGNLKVTEDEKKDRAWKIRRWVNDLNANFAIYQGKGTGIYHDGDAIGCRLGGNVVLKSCASLPSTRNFKIFADNFFSNFTTVSELCWYHQQQSYPWSST